MVSAKTDTELSLFYFGNKIFKGYCASCHKSSCDSNQENPDLRHLKNLERDTIQDYIRKILTNGKGQMPVFTFLSDIEIAAITSFILDEGHEEYLEENEIKSGLVPKIPWIATGHTPITTPDGYPINKRPWGTLTAINLDKGKIKWQIPLGTYPKLEALGLPPTGTFNMGGSIVTAGDLVFIGASMDERLHAFDKDSGKLLWEFKMEAGGYATPSTFQIDGIQYLVMAAGGGGKPGTKSRDAYYCFQLPEK
jgi:quinoprotein glucose dehydrogenase